MKINLIRLDWRQALLRTHQSLQHCWLAATKPRRSLKTTTPITSKPLHRPRSRATRRSHQIELRCARSDPKPGCTRSRTYTYNDILQDVAIVYTLRRGAIGGSASPSHLHLSRSIVLRQRTLACGEIRQDVLWGH
ncbi:hypothetical protein D6D25_02412 [Aureobasidium pullulans]|nr:hypothetical protein D6D25_02412 [Aureobasidium pullulans]